jgi:hypothetical protein
VSLFSPKPLASSAKTTNLSDVETNFRNAVAIVGGTSYNAGVSTGSVPGAIGRDNLKVGRWIRNARKTEPQAWSCYTARLDSAATGNTFMFLPMNLGMTLPEITEVGFSYGSITGAANFSGSLLTNIASSMTITNLAPLASATLLDDPYTAPTGDTGGGLYIALTISTIGVTIKDAVVTVSVKSWHIA